jgi:type III secretion system YopN/LcrE/InvE/MxiC family regulator
MAFDAAQILRQTYAAGAQRVEVPTFTQTPSAAESVGRLMGTNCHVEVDPSAELQDSMEELSMQFEEKSLKRVADRKLGEMQGPRSALVRAIENWTNVLPDMPGSEFLMRLAKHLRAMQQGGNMPDVRDLLKELGRGSTDPSNQFAMLDILEQAFGADEEELRALVRQAKIQLSSEKGPEIRAGINLAQEINTLATSPEEMQELRDMYRGEVVGFTTPQECFRSLLASRGAGGLSAALQFLVAGCGRDLASAQSSIDPAALGRILTDLGCVNSLAAMLDAFSALATRMDAQFGEKCLMDGEQMTGRVVDLTEQSFVPASAIAAFLGDCGLVRLAAQMDFARELTRLFRLLSPRLFSKEGDRQRLVEAAQEHLDGLITLENEQLEEEEARAS